MGMKGKEMVMGGERESTKNVCENATRNLLLSKLNSKAKGEQTCQSHYLSWKHRLQNEKPSNSRSCQRIQKNNREHRCSLGLVPSTHVRELALRELSPSSGHSGQYTHTHACIKNICNNSSPWKRCIEYTLRYINRYIPMEK